MFRRSHEYFSYFLSIHIRAWLRNLARKEATCACTIAKTWCVYLTRNAYYFLSMATCAPHFILLICGRACMRFECDMLRCAFLAFWLLGQFCRHQHQRKTTFTSLHLPEPFIISVLQIKCVCLCATKRWATPVGVLRHLCTRRTTRAKLTAGPTLLLPQGQRLSTSCYEEAATQKMRVVACTAPFFSSCCVDGIPCTNGKPKTQTLISTHMHSTVNTFDLEQRK